MTIDLSMAFGDLFQTMQRFLDDLLLIDIT